MKDLRETSEIEREREKDDKIKLLINVIYLHLPNYISKLFY